MKSIIKIDPDGLIRRAYELDVGIQQLKSVVARGFITLGEYLKEMRDGELYYHLDCESFEEYIARPEIGFKRASVYNFIRFYELYILKLGMEPHLLSSIGHGRLLTIAPVVEENPKEWISMAQTLSMSDLINETRVARGKKPMVPKVQDVANPLDVSEGYLAFLKRQPCCVCGAKQVETAHYPRTRGAGAKDDEAIPLCHKCHQESHYIGFHSFFNLYGKQIFEYVYQTFRRLFHELGKSQVVDNDRDNTATHRADVGNHNDYGREDAGEGTDNMVGSRVGGESGAE